MASDTICAIATAQGRGGIGIIRISGPKSLEFAKKIIHFSPKPRQAYYCDFHDGNNVVVDQGIILYFPAPHSFTGEHVVELQGHGGPVVLDILISQITALGARLANPGEFSERAFLNDKLDLAQAEAIADLIDASSERAARQALNSLKGQFSQKVENINAQIIRLRMFVESAIDFPEEEIDFLTDGKVEQELKEITRLTEKILFDAEQGAIIREGMNVVIAGRPNAGKSSLLNTLAERDVAIVTNIEGTTRDVLKEQIHIDGMPLHIVDTAGLREGTDEVEKIGIARAWGEMENADAILLVIDSTDTDQRNYFQHWQSLFNNEKLNKKLTIIFNKIDLVENESNVIQSSERDPYKKISISAKTGKGLPALKAHLKSIMGFQANTEGGFSARRRHLDALRNTLDLLHAGQEQLHTHSAGELLAEDLRLAHEALSRITGKFSADDLLGEIFSNFCIGK